ncbi:atp-dependent rna helicase [Ceraceosorus bombacis]|uniref:Atp-dependent rna helicase n=1 Tax=Ceraceosorus bombacis TaxID=401625 RepID=A0A0P1BF56_9BASI|nr:atp-dependent rna helicase [Ceraceosorus bombacis]
MSTLARPLDAPSTSRVGAANAAAAALAAKRAQQSASLAVSHHENAGRQSSGMKDAPSMARTEASITSFTQLGLSARLERALSALRITVPTPIQASALPSIFSSSDIIAGSPTGSGKTLAFALPILSSLEKDLIAGAAVILTPTRELAQQLYEQIVAVATGAALGVNVALVLGGQDMMRQAQLLNQRPNIVVATPGRLADLLGNADHQALSRCKYVVLDEADRLLTPTFSDALSTIFSALPPSSMRQTLLFSATLTPAIEALATKPRSVEERPVRVCRIEGPTSTPPQLVQKYIFVPSHVREPYLYHLLLNAPCPSRSQGDGRSRWTDEEARDVEMTEHSMPEEKVLERLNAVSTAKRIANLELHDTKSGARQEHNKKKAAERVKSEEKRRKRKQSKAPLSAF